jgi:hypothetical protein
LLTTKWLENLGTKIDAITQDMIDAHQPDGIIEEDEKVAGTVPENLKKLKVIHSQMIDDLEKRNEEHQKSHRDPGHTSADCEKFHEEMAPVKRELKVIGQLFWLSLEDELGIGHNVNLAIRQDWQVVFMPEQEEEEEESGIPIGMATLIIGHRH